MEAVMDKTEKTRNGPRRRKKERKKVNGSM